MRVSRLPAASLIPAPQGGGRLTLAGNPESQNFTFDAVAGEGVSQEGLFRLVGRPIVKNCLAGYNSSIFAYGQVRQLVARPVPLQHFYRSFNSFLPRAGWLPAAHRVPFPPPQMRRRAPARRSP